MKKILIIFLFFLSLQLRAQYYYHWALEQKYTTASSINQINYINGLIGSLKRDAVWNNLDVFWNYATETQQQAVWNIKSPGTNTCTEVNIPSWVAKKGYTSNGTTSYLNTNFNPSTQAVNFTLNSGSLGIYSRSNIAEAGYDMGVYQVSGGHLINILSRTATNTMANRVNTTATTTLSNSNSLGLIAAARTTSTLTTFYRNGSSIGTVADASSSIPAFNVFVNCLSSDGAAGSFSTKEISMAFMGSGGILQSNLNTAFEAYMDALGTGVE